MAGLVHRRQNGDNKQIGCMSGFLQIFDRQQILARKCIHSAKRLHSSTDLGASPETVSSGESEEFSKEVEKPEPKKHVVVVVVPASSDDFQSSPVDNDNGRQTVDGDDNQWRPPGVIAKLMGLEPLRLSDQKTQRTVETKRALPSSVSESRVSRDLGHSKYIDGNNFQLKQPNQSQKQSNSKSMKIASENLKSECSRNSPRRSRSFFHSADFFPEPNQTTVTMHVDLEQKLKIKPLEEQLNHLNALKQILEVLQLKGLLHSTSRSNRDSHRNFVYEFSIHLKQWRSLASKVDQHRSVNSSGRAVDRSGINPVRSRTASPNRIESNLKSCNSIINTKPLGIEIERRANESSDSSRTSPKKIGYPRNHKLTHSSSINSPNQDLIKNIVTYDVSTSDSERSRWEYCREGKRLLERCGNLLHSIEEMNRTTESATVLPSPVSVHDSGFDKDDSSSIDFKATSIVDFEEDNWSPKISPTEREEFISDDSDFIYISDILRDDSTVFFSTEKQIYDANNNTSTVSKCHRKLVFDVIREILDRNRQLRPWKASLGDSLSSIKQIWYEFQKIRDMIINTGNGDGLLELISGVLNKDLVEIKDWEDYPIETSEVIMDTERLIFKDLVTDAIRDLVEFSGECKFSRTRRKLVF